MVAYTSFQGEALELTPWEGRNIVLLTQSSDLDAGVMQTIVSKLDEAYDFYARITGREPSPNFTYNGKASIAEVENTCGAGCGWLGSTGIEIMPPYFNTLYTGVRDAGLYDQVLFYELGRNFWFYDQPLLGLPSFTTGFAIENRFLSMDAADVNGGAFNEQVSWDQLVTFIQQDMSQLYFSNPNLDWRNTLATDTAPQNPYNFGGADLAGSLLHRLYEDFGEDNYARFWQSLITKEAAATPEQARANFLAAAKDATGVDYSWLFKEGWQFKTGTGNSDTLRSDAKKGNYAVLGFGGDDTLRGSKNAELMVGGLGNDTLYGDRGNDTLLGSVGDDWIQGGEGVDLLAGGDGKDRFVIRSVKEAGNGAQHDTILDFSKNDTLDVSGIDANTRQRGDQAFTFIDGAEFHRKAGELRWAGGMVQGDVNGDGRVDFQITLQGLDKLLGGNIIL
ncbi:M10 family metallopeptidase C-terminal domain-containing protein [Azospirillum brasilense]|uniref:Peptidase M10 serralysin C-terminal domain-containing protein n=1 Tax=Azospirillum brasilense TaxID=192 RepID=A0A235HBK7_AZOBR|nr:hypothetical protein [Azospirillum brasilense]OYD82897.1 hypothetical protein CHT98_18580 [Azospirillum brasilense]